MCLYRLLNVKALVDAFYKDKVLVLSYQGPYSTPVLCDCEGLFTALDMDAIKKKNEDIEGVTILSNFFINCSSWIWKLLPPG